MEELETSASRLVAYLDGELSEAESLSIEREIGRDPETRRAIDELARVYEALDHLPRPSASEEFTEQTMASVRSEMTQTQPTEIKQTRDLRQYFEPASVALTAFIITWIGIGISSWVSPPPSRQALEELELLERFDEFASLPNSEFLQKLAKDEELREELRQSNDNVF